MKVEHERVVDDKGRKVVDAWMLLRTKRGELLDEVPEPTSGGAPTAAAAPAAAPAAAAPATSAAAAADAGGEFVKASTMLKKVRVAASNDAGLVDGCEVEKGRVVKVAETNGDWIRIELTPSGPGGWVQRKDKRRVYVEPMPNSAEAAQAWHSQTTAAAPPPQRPKLKTNTR